ncbi:MAG: universal stress protein [Xanthobacter sp.]
MLHNIKSVLVGMTEEGMDEPSSALSYGLSLAHQAAAHATIQAASLKVVMGSAFISSVARELVAGHNQRLRDAAEQLAIRAMGDATAAGVNCSVETPQLSYTELVNAAVAQARLQDVSILDAETDTINADRGLIEALVFNSGRPLIVVPAGVEEFRCERVLIAWDGSSRAARALNDAMPILKSATTVELVSVVSKEDLQENVPGAEIAPHLVRHGVNVTVKGLAVSDDGAAATLRDQASLFNADMIVMGAFNHSIMRQWMLGGVTQELLKECKVPLFMSY